MTDPLRAAGTMRHRLRTLTLKLVTGSPAEPWLRHAYGRLARTQAARYDRETAAVMRRVLTPASNGIDAGCYRGGLLHEMVALAPHGRHFAFEPLPEHHRYLVARFPTVRVFDVALADAPGQAVFQHVVGRPARSGLRRVEYPDPGQSIEEIAVSVDTLDRAVPADVKIDFLKIDVEGAELAVLRGGAQLIRRWRPVVMFESGWERAATYGATPEQLHEFLTEELDLAVSLMRRWLDGEPALSRRDFCSLLYAKAEFCFLAYPRVSGSR
jgi:FkbM family methyltransferase